MTCAHIVYSGHVQGIGFRYTVRSLASDLDLVGWVKNLPDGQVEILVQGEKDTIDQLTDEIDRHFRDYIRGKEITFQESKEKFKDFRIEF